MEGARDLAEPHGSAQATRAWCSISSANDDNPEAHY
jgi:hypothetical protein